MNKFICIILALLSPLVFSKTIKLSKEDMKLLEDYQNKSKPNKKVQKKKGKYKIYKPAPVVRNTIEERGFIIERDSMKIEKLKISTNDVVDILVCKTNPIHIAFDQNYDEVIQNTLLDGNQVDFETKTFDNNRGVYVRLKEAVPRGKIKESALRLVLKSNDKALMFNLVGIPCNAEGLNKYPKTYYISEKKTRIDRDNQIFTAEDMIIQMSEGYKRVNRPISLRDMNTSANSDWVVFGLQINVPKELESDKYLYDIKVLDNLQVNTIPEKTEYLPLHSKKFTKQKGMVTLRYKLSVNVGKKYLLNDRYIHLMILDKKRKEYVYELVDLEPYYQSLIQRGWKL